MINQKSLETDVLVIGGGIAGCLAAINARKNGSEVILVDKGYVSSSGQTPYADSFCIFNEDWGDNLDAWMKQVNIGGDYLNNRSWTETIFKDSYSIYKDMLSYGIEFLQDENGKLVQEANPRLGPLKTSFLADKRESCKTLRTQVLKCGSKIVDRVMMTDLIKQNGKVVGAVGISASQADFYVFSAKAVIICTGAAGLKLLDGQTQNLTADGDMMAYRAGATISGKELNDVHLTHAMHPTSAGPRFLDKETGHGPPPANYTNAKGEKIEGLSLFHLAPEYEAHKGNAPISWDIIAENIPKKEGELFPEPSTMVGGASGGMATHKSEGIWPIGLNGNVGIDGLYAAGDSLCVMLSGAAYATTGAALSGSAIIGKRAGLEAAKYADGIDKTPLDSNIIKDLEITTFAPLNRQGGFSPSWVLDLLRNTLVPYFALIIKKEDRLQAALTQVMFYKDHLMPRLTAKDAHDLRLAIEAKNLVCNAEMKLKASLLRKESRGTHYREDYPQRDDENLLCWILIKEVDGEMVLTKEPIPESWRPDKTKSEKENYLFEFPRFDSEEVK